MGFIDKPQQLWLRKAAFQVHLWMGILVCLYMLAMGVSGSILVFKEELAARTTTPQGRPPYPEGAPVVPVDTVLARVRDVYPGSTPLGVYAPGPGNGAYSVTIQAPKEGSDEREVISLDADPATGSVLGVKPPRVASWVDTVREFHFFLLLGGAGWKLNGYGAICLIVLAATGLVVWWPGINTWRRTLVVNFRRSWKRVVWDLHGMSGLWSIGFLLVWGVTSVTFIWPEETRQLIRPFSPVGSAYPRVQVETKLDGELGSVSALIATAEKNSPGAKFWGIELPGSPERTVTVYVTRTGKPDYADSNYHIFEPATGKELAVWQRGANPSSGDNFLTLLRLLHFGTGWGLFVKVVWALVGGVLPLLAITGLVMYWNRTLSKKWRQLKQTPTPKIIRRLPEVGADHPTARQ